MPLVPEDDGREQERRDGERQIGAGVDEPAPLLALREHVEAGAADQEQRRVLAQEAEAEHRAGPRPPEERPARSRVHENVGEAFSRVTWESAMVAEP